MSNLRQVHARLMQCQRHIFTVRRQFLALSSPAPCLSVPSAAAAAANSVMMKTTMAD